MFAVVSTASAALVGQFGSGSLLATSALSGAFDVDVAVLPVTNYSSHLTVTPTASGGSHIEWRGAFYRGYPNNEPPPELNDEAAIQAVTGVYRAGLDALAERFGKAE